MENFRVVQNRNIAAGAQAIFWWQPLPKTVMTPLP